MSTSATPAPGAHHLTLADQLLQVQDAQAGRTVPERLPLASEIGALVEDLLTVLFPEVGRAAPAAGGSEDLRQGIAAALAALEPHLEMAVFAGIHRRCRNEEDKCRERARGITVRAMAALPEMRALLLKDVQAALDGDPAASGPDEVIACYPGLYAMSVYRVAHRLLLEGSEILPRMMTEHAKSRTGIDIHPGATIGSSFFIDHGTGIVIGETTHIGNSVRIYQGVTLGALSIKRREEGAVGAKPKRHPTIEDEVIIYANATILGGNTVIGRGAVVGGNTFITYSVPPGTRVAVGA
jgi:serine O-acetyltransferase